MSRTVLGGRPAGGGPVPRASREGSLDWRGLARDPYRVVLFVLMVLTVSRVHQHFGFVSAMRPALLLGLVALAIAVFNPGRLNTDLFRTWPAKIVAGIAIMACISVPFGISIGNSGSFVLSSYSKVLIFAFLLIAAMRGTRDLAFFVWGYVVSCGILVWMAHTVFSVGGRGLSRLHSMYTYDSNDMAVVLMAALPLALLTYQSSGRKGKIASVLVLVGIGTSLALSGSRGGFLGLVAVGLALLFLLKRVSLLRRLSFVGVVVGGLVIFAPTGYWQQMGTILEPTEDYNFTSDQGRWAIWKRGVGYMASNPVTGIGVANFPRAEGMVSDLALDPTRIKGVKWAAAHNSHLQIAAEMGLPGLALWLALIVGGVVKLIRLRRRLPARWARGDPEERFLYYTTEYLPVSLIGFAAAGAFVSFAYLDTIYILAAFMAGFYVSLERKRARDAAEGRVVAGPPGLRPHPSRSGMRPVAARGAASGRPRRPRYGVQRIGGPGARS